MKKTPRWPEKPRFADCPYCGEPFDLAKHHVVECPECGKEGSTACCCPGGVGCPCPECEEKED